jgi:uncharacterized membrane protein YidH (DUF202 family)
VSGTVGGTMGAPLEGPWDPGLQPERTALAWQRTGLALVVAALVAVRDGVVVGGPAGAVVLVPALAAALCGLAVVRLSRTELDARVTALRAGAPLPPPVATRAAAAGVLLLAVAAVGVLLA